jgi:hypothetical protein
LPNIMLAEESISIRCRKSQTVSTIF